MATFDSANQPGGVTRSYGPLVNTYGAGESPTDGIERKITVELNNAMDPAGEARVAVVQLPPNASLVNAQYLPDVSDPATGTVRIARSGVGLADTQAVAAVSLNSITLTNTAGNASADPDTITVDMTAYSGTATGYGKLVLICTVGTTR